MSIPRLFELALVGATTLASSVAWATPPAATESRTDELSAYRERFKAGMDRYDAGAVSEAIGYWEPIYRQLGPQTGYRLAYNLGVAYVHLGDATRAAERLQSFLDEVGARRSQGQALGALVAKEEADAHQRLADLAATKGRIRIPTADRPIHVQVDANEPRVAGFVAWVEPGEHTVTFEIQGSKSETSAVQAKAGELVEVPLPAQPVPATVLPVAPSPQVPPEPAAPRSALEPMPSPPRPDAYETRRPFSPIVLAAGAGLEVAVTLTAIALESRALNTRDELANAASTSGTIQPDDRRRFDEERTWAYAAVGAAAGLGTITVALASWYFLGASKHAVGLQPIIGPERGGAIAGAQAHF